VDAEPPPGTFLCLSALPGRPVRSAGAEGFAANGAAPAALAGRVPGG
jgi:hypothetical protein